MDNLEDQEYGVGLFESISFLLTHPGRLKHYFGPAMDAIGDKIQGKPFYIPGLRWCDHGLEIYTRHVQNMERGYVPVSAFLP
jgi:hypothetical protein